MCANLSLRRLNIALCSVPSAAGIHADNPAVHLRHILLDRSHRKRSEGRRRLRRSWPVQSRLHLRQRTSTGIVSERTPALPTGCSRSNYYSICRPILQQSRCSGTHFPLKLCRFTSAALAPPSTQRRRHSPALRPALVPPPVPALLQDLDCLPARRRLVVLRPAVPVGSLVVLGLSPAASVRSPAAFASAECRGSSTTRLRQVRSRSLPTSCCFSSAASRVVACPSQESVPALHSLEVPRNPEAEALRSPEVAALHTQREEAPSAAPPQLEPLQLEPEPSPPPSHRSRISRRSAHCPPTACHTCCRKPPYVLSLLESRSLLPESHFAAALVPRLAGRLSEPGIYDPRFSDP